MLFLLKGMSPPPPLVSAPRRVKSSEMLRSDLELSLDDLRREVVEKDQMIHDLVLRIERLESECAARRKSSTSSQGSMRTNESWSPRRRRSLVMDEEEGLKNRNRLGSFLSFFGVPKKGGKSVPRSERQITDTSRMFEEVQYQEWSYEELRSGMAQGVDPDHLERHLTEEDCLHHFGMSREMLELLPEGKLETLKERTGLTRIHYTYSRPSTSTASSPGTANSL